ncbi:MAG: hypothetical protein IJE14_06540 [Clostridia bacterium]|nr:hypothetical protein [Clostridia bacterium]
MKFIRIISLLLCFAVLSGTGAVFASGTREKATPVQPSTWAAVDGLGRTLSDGEAVGGRRQDKFVGVFYWTWHYRWVNDHEPLTTGSVLDKYPEAVNDWEHPAWGNTYDGRPYFWDEPLYGFYTSTDRYVLRKHAELLTDADVDVVIFDTTNGTLLFEPSASVLLEVWSEAKADGVDVPQVAFILNFGGAEDTRTQLRTLYEIMYSQGLYEDMWFMWEGKPLVMADITCLDLDDEIDKEIFDFFTFRDNEATYFADDTDFLDDTWGWCSDYEQTRFGKRIFGGVEQMCVSVAQNANEYGLNALNCPEGTVQGRSFTDGVFSYTYSYAGKEITVDKDTENSLLYGLNFQQQWDYAIENDPEFIFVTGFNEWIAGRWKEWNGTENAFPDQFSPEYSRDIEPSKGVLKDHYYYQLVENIRRFKGVDAQRANGAQKTIDISADTVQWESVQPEYSHYTGGENRDSAGWLGTYYTNDTRRNDIAKAKVAYDSDNVYFCVETVDELTPETDSAWMRLFVDTDTSGVSPNWEGFEYVINRNSPENGKVTVERSVSGWSFETVALADYSVSGNVLQIAVPRSALGPDGEAVKFNFKWADNVQSEDILDFYTDGDVAPGGRFTFVFDSTADGEEIPPREADENIFAKLFKLLFEKYERQYADLRKLINYYL